MKKLVGKTDIEDALGRLDRLTQDEGWMASASGLKATYDVDDKVQAVDDKVQGVDDKVQGVDNRVRDVDEKINLIIDGVQFIFQLSSTSHLIYLARR